jgi:hypothetical protein
MPKNLLKPKALNNTKKAQREKEQEKIEKNK